MLHPWTWRCGPASLSSLIIPNFFYFLLTPSPDESFTIHVILLFTWFMQFLPFPLKKNPFMVLIFYLFVFLRFENFNYYCVCVYIYTWMCVSLCSSCGGHRAISWRWLSTSTFLWFWGNSGSRLALQGLCPLSHLVETMLTFQISPSKMMFCSLSGISSSMILFVLCVVLAFIILNWNCFPVGLPIHSVSLHVFNTLHVCRGPGCTKMNTLYLLASVSSRVEIGI